MANTYQPSVQILVGGGAGGEDTSSPLLHFINYQEYILAKLFVFS